MAEVFYWGTFVVLPGSNHLQVSSTIIRWEQKDDIQVVESNKMIIALEGEQCYSELKRNSAECVSKVLALQWGEEAIHMTCGVANAVDSWTVLKGVVPHVKTLPNSPFTENNLELYELLQDNPMWGLIIWEGWRVVTPEDFLREMLGWVLRDIFEGWPRNNMLEVDLRYYDVGYRAREALQRSDYEWVKNADAFFWVDDVNYLRRLLPKIVNSDGVLPREVINIVRKIAIKSASIFSQQYKEDWHGNVVGSRFSRAPYEEYIVNEVFKDPYLKKIYVETLMEKIWISHNVCFKPNWEKSNPPFADVVATFLADKMDKRDGTDPCDVWINNR